MSESIYCYVSNWPDCKWSDINVFRSATAGIKQEMAEAKKTFYVYAHYFDGRLVYIGCGANKRRAWSYSYRNHHWYESFFTCADYAPVIISWHDDIEDALSVEAFLIRACKPIHNRGFPSLPSPETDVWCPPKYRENAATQ